jgi:hypothetical protein
MDHHTIHICNNLTTLHHTTIYFLEMYINLGLLNDFFPFMPVLDAVFPIIYFHDVQIILTSSWTSYQLIYNHDTECG